MLLPPLRIKTLSPLTWSVLNKCISSVPSCASDVFERWPEPPFHTNRCTRTATTNIQTMSHGEVSIYSARRNQTWNSSLWIHSVVSGNGMYYWILKLLRNLKMCVCEETGSDGVEWRQFTQCKAVCNTVGIVLFGAVIRFKLIPYWLYVDSTWWNVIYFFNVNTIDAAVVILQTDACLVYSTQFCQS